MGDVVNISTRRRAVAFRYKEGDMVAALKLAVDHPEVAGDLEEVLSDLLFGSDFPEDDADAARDVLFRILEAASNSSGGDCHA